MNMREFDERLRIHADLIKSHLNPPEIDLEKTVNEKECTDLKFKKKYISVIAAAAFIALLGTVALGEAFGWNSALLEYFHLSSEQTEMLNSATAFPQASVTHSGVTITVRQTLSDGHGLYILYDVEAPEGFEFIDDIHFGTSILDPDSEVLDDENRSSSWTNQTLYQSGNKRTAIMCCSTESVIKSGRLKLIFLNLGYTDRDYVWPEDSILTETDAGGGKDISVPVKYDDEADSAMERDNAERLIMPDFVPLIEGRWELCWDFEYENVAETIEVNKLVHFDNGQELTLKKIELSPISIWLELDQYFDQQPSEAPADTALANADGVESVITIPDMFVLPEPVITLRDGATVKLTNKDGYAGGYSAFGDLVGGTHTGKWNFDDGVIDTANIASITVGDLTVEIE